MPFYGGGSQKSKWNEALVKKALGSCETYGEAQKKYPRAVVLAKRDGYIKDVFPDYEPRKYVELDEKEIMRRLKTLSGSDPKYRHAYRKAKKLGLDIPPRSFTRLYTSRLRDDLSHIPGRRLVDKAEHVATQEPWLTNQELAQRLKISNGTARNALHSARKKLGIDAQGLRRIRRERNE